MDQPQPSRSAPASTIPSLFARDMQRTRPACDCQAETSRIINLIPASSPPSHGPTTVSMPLSDILSVGRSLVRHWERLNGCPNANSHLDALLLRTMADAAGRVLGLYEVAVEGVLGGWDEREREGEGGSRGATSSQSSRSSSITNIDAHYNGPSSSTLRGPYSSSSSTPLTGGPLVCTRSPTSLGSVMLEDEEATMVAREALRHSAMRLGEMLHDIEEDIGYQEGRGEGGGGGSGHGGGGRADEDTRRVRGVTTRLLRLLGRINNSP